MEYDKTIRYSYTDREFKNAFFNSAGSAPIGASVVLLASDIYFITAYFKRIFVADKTSIFVIAFVSVMLIVSVICSFTDAPKHMAFLRAEQKIYFRENTFYYESGEHVFKIDIKYISKIRQTKNFYIIKIALTRFDVEYADLIGFPQIPRRCVQSVEMRHLAALLNIEYKDSLFWK